MYDHTRTVMIYKEKKLCCRGHGFSVKSCESLNVNGIEKSVCREVIFMEMMYRNNLKYWDR